jgi:hypothetical protein
MGAATAFDKFPAEVDILGGDLIRCRGDHNRLMERKFHD